MYKIMFVIWLLFCFVLGWNVGGQIKHIEKCKDAGGVYVTNTVCINPSAVIEVN